MNTVGTSAIFFLFTLWEGSSVTYRHHRGGSENVDNGIIRDQETRSMVGSTSQVSVSNCSTLSLAQTGLTARLFCCLGTVNKELRISWVRKRDLMILSHDTTVFTTDKRVQVHFYPTSGLWELRILFVDQEDGGEYECQTNTEPQNQIVISLVVQDMMAVIGGPKEVFLKAGSLLRIHCNVDLGSRGPDDHFRQTAVLHWFINQRLIDPGAGRETGAMRTTTNLGTETFQGWLTVAHTTPAHSGNYSCVPSYATPDWVIVHVIPDEDPVGLLDGTGHQLNGGTGLRYLSFSFRHIFYSLAISMTSLLATFCKSYSNI